MPYSTPSAVGRHVLTLDDSVGIPQYPPAPTARCPLFYPLWTTVYSHLSGSLIRPAAAVGYTVLGGSSTERMPSSEPSSRPGPPKSILVPYSGIDPQLLGFRPLSGTRVGNRTCDLSIKGSNPLPTRLSHYGGLGFEGKTRERFIACSQYTLRRQQYRFANKACSRYTNAAARCRRRYMARRARPKRTALNANGANGTRAL